MVKHYQKTSNLLLGLILAGTIAGCAGASAKQDGSDGHETSVTWTQEFGMPSLLEQTPEVNSQKDLRKLLELPWYASIDVGSRKLETARAIKSCNDYFSVKSSDLRAQQEQEHSALLEFIVMCEATRLLSYAAPAEYSHIPAQPLDAQLPNKLPKSLALVTSQSERNRFKNDQSISSWADVNAISMVEQPSAHQSEFRSDAGLQTLSILGRGDLNGDGREDLLVSVKDSVEGGSYFHLRLFVLTVTEQGDWQIEAAY